MCSPRSLFLRRKIGVGTESFVHTGDFIDAVDFVGPTHYKNRRFHWRLTILIDVLFFKMDALIDDWRRYRRNVECSRTCANVMVYAKDRSDDAISLRWCVVDVDGEISICERVVLLFAFLCLPILHFFDSVRCNGKRRCVVVFSRGIRPLASDSSILNLLGQVELPAEIGIVASLGECRIKVLPFDWHPLCFSN